MNQQNAGRSGRCGSREYYGLVMCLHQSPTDLGNKVVSSQRPNQGSSSSLWRLLQPTAAPAADTESPPGGAQSFRLTTTHL